MLTRLAFFALAGLPLFSATIQHSATIPAHTPAFFPIGPYWFVLDFPRFDPSAGSLQRVEIETRGKLTGNGGYENLSIYAASVIITAGVVFYGELLPSPYMRYTGDGTGGLPPFDGKFDYAGTSGRSFVLDLSDIETATYESPSDLALFIGSGSRSFTVFSDAGEFPAIGSSIDPMEFPTFLNWTASGEVTITYTFDPSQAIPEPSSLALVSAALGLLAWRRFSLRGKPAVLAGRRGA